MIRNLRRSEHYAIGLLLAGGMPREHQLIERLQRRRLIHRWIYMPIYSRPAAVTQAGVESYFSYPTSWSRGPFQGCTPPANAHPDARMASVRMATWFSERAR